MVTLAYGAAANNCRSRGLKFASDTGEIVPDSTQAQSIIAKTPTSPTATVRVAICLPCPTASSHAVFNRNSLRPPDAKAAFRTASPNVLHINPIRDGDSAYPLVTLAGTTYNINNERRSGDASFDAAWLFMNAAFFLLAHCPSRETAPRRWLTGVARMQ